MHVKSVYGVPWDHYDICFDAAERSWVRGALKVYAAESLGADYNAYT